MEKKKKENVSKIASTLLRFPKNGARLIFSNF